jgi:hypothetical protein
MLRLLTFGCMLTYSQSRLILLLTQALLEVIMAFMNHFPLFRLMLKIKDKSRIPGEHYIFHLSNLVLLIQSKYHREYCSDTLKYHNKQIDDTSKVFWQSTKSMYLQFLQNQAKGLVQIFAQYSEIYLFCEKETLN